MSSSLNDGFSKIGLIELLVVVVVSELVSCLINASIRLEGTNLIFDIFYFIFIFIFFVYKLRDCKFGFKNDLRSFWHDVDFKEVIVYSILLFFVVQGIDILVIYSDVFSAFCAFLSDYSPSILITDYLVYDAGYSVLFNIPLSHFNWAILTLITCCIFVPIQSELVFRGVFLNRLKGKMNLIPAILISSALFIFIVSSDIFLGIVMGIFLSIIYLKTRNIFVSMTVFFWYEIFNILDLDFLSDTFYYGPYVGIFALISFVSLILLIKYAYDNWSIIKDFK